VIGRYAHHWISIGQAGRFFRLARAENCRDVLFIGSVLRPPISQLRLDWQTIRLLPHLARAYRGGDDKLLSGVAAIAESGGLRVVGVKEVAPEVFMPEGALGRHQPSERDNTDIKRALSMIAALGPFDVGQAAVVANNNVIAVEAAEGTDNMLARIAELRRLGRVTAALGTGVLVKAPKPGQDRRFDLPSIGPRTIENVVRAGLAGLAVTAGSTMIAEADQVTAAADRAGIFLVGVSEDRAQ
jgi:UDP-2,3-diacylglucosamine hydrolase